MEATLWHLDSEEVHLRAALSDQKTRTVEVQSIYHPHLSGVTKAEEGDGEN